MIHTTNSYLKVTMEDESVMNITVNHPVYDAQGDTWKPIGEFSFGDYVRLSNGKTIKIESVKIIDEQKEVYNFEVEGNHNYYVSDSKILVHNKLATTT